MREWKTGDPLDPESRVGVLVSKAHFDKVVSYLDEAKKEKLVFAHGGETWAGVYVEPSVVDGVTAGSRLFREEIFGPVLSVTTFNTPAEAVALANGTDYGLAASVCRLARRRGDARLDPHGNGSRSSGGPFDRRHRRSARPAHQRRHPARQEARRRGRGVTTGKPRMRRSFFCIDAHTCGNPVRLVAGGGPLLPHLPIAERRDSFVREHDWIRQALMSEPRGHDVVSGAILYPADREDCDFAAIFTLGTPALR
jgi:hypothetical protein